MSIQDSSPTDYSDYEYQQFEVQLVVEGDGSDDAATVDGLIQLDPLDPIGGLDNNEVAELVGYRMHVGIEVEDSAEDGDQNVGASIEFRGTFGANFNGAEDSISLNEIGERSADTAFLNSTGATDTQVNATSTARDEVFDSFRVTGAAPFDDQGNGLGGGGDSTLQTLEHYYRDTVGRGPVLDSNDDLGIVAFLIASDHIVPVAGIIQGHLIWDVAQTDDAGRAFSVPSGMM